MRLLLLVFASCFVKPAPAQNRESRLDSFFSAIDKNGGISGSVLIAGNGQVLYQKSFGYADAQREVPNTANTVFQLASVSKIFTAIAVLQLCEHKKLNLADRFSKYFPDFPYPEVTIRQMLSNTSGIPDVGEVLLPFWRLNRDTVFTLHDLIPALKMRKLPLNFQAGGGWDYSNINYCLLALAVEKVSGTGFGNYLSERIFKPAGMKSSFVKTAGSNPYTHPNVAYNYAFPFMLSATPVRVDSFAIADYKVHYKTWPSEGDANVYSSVSDLMHFDEALYKGLLLKRSSLALVFAPSRGNSGRNIVLHGVESESGVIGDFYWGFGNRISLDSSLGKIVWESGGMPGCSANMISNVTKHQLLIWLDNKQSIASMNNIFGALRIINDSPSSPIRGRKQVAGTYGQILEKKGEDYAFSRLIAMASDTADYVLDENELNALGYEFFNDGKVDMAFDVFRAAIVLFPNSDNVYNSYGELLAKVGRKEEAVIMLKKSLLLNPKNEDSKKDLEGLGQK